MEYALTFAIGLIFGCVIILFLKQKINKILADNTKKSLKQIEKDTDRNFFMSPEEAVDYGLIDKIITNRL